MDKEDNVKKGDVKKDDVEKGDVKKDDVEKGDVKKDEEDGTALKNIAEKTDAAEEAIKAAEEEAEKALKKSGVGDAADKIEEEAKNAKKIAEEQANKAAEEAAEKIGVGDAAGQFNQLNQAATAFTTLQSFAAKIIPESAWRGIAKATLDKICEITRDAPTNDAATPRLQIIEYTNELLEETIKKIDKDIFSRKIEEIIHTKMLEPFNDIFEVEFILLNTMNEMLKDNKNKDEITNYIKEYLETKEKEYKNDETKKNENIYDSLNSEDIFSYMKNKGNPDNKNPVYSIGGGGNEGPAVATTDGVDDKATEVAKDGADDKKDDDDDDDNDDDSDSDNADDKDNGVKTTGIGTENIPGTGISTKNIPGTGIGTGNIKVPNFGVASAVSEVSSGLMKEIENILDQYNITITTLIKDGLSKKDPDFLDKMQMKITDASAFHLKKPEGRQMFLRIFDPLLTNCVNSITGIESMRIPLFAKCLNSNGIKEIINQLKKKHNSVDSVANFIEDLSSKIEKKKIETHPMGGMYIDLKKKIVKTLINGNPMVAFNPNARSKTNQEINNMIDNKKGKDEARKYTGGKKSRNQKYLPKKQYSTRKRK